MTDMLKKLPRLMWRGFEVPVLTRKATFEQDDVVHKFEFRDKELLESQGVRNWRLSYTIPFREDITRAPYKNLFSRVFVDFVAACRDRTPGLLMDPVLGVFRAKVANFSDETDVNKRDGDDVSVDFIEAPEIDDIDALSGALVGVDSTSDARAIDAAVAKINWKQIPSPEPTVDALSAVDGAIRQVEASGTRIEAAYEDFAFKCQKIETSIDRLGTPSAWLLRKDVRRARLDALVRAASGDSDTKGKLRKAVTSGGPVAVVAQSYRMSVQAFLALNQELARLPLVPPNTPIRYIQAA